ncbi:hypothetical protein DXT97_10535 [Agrobacterium tumefaciens]|uniref:NACHT domain-containing protein n=1 Tax=Agrobacterium tumefaciens TaxID=358 RepID=UPI00129551C4|nr:hypothetical protein [Agrobacterium tumefaciens]MQB37234.1 hypothetical protein [Agrobacterium tumefaciens]
MTKQYINRRLKVGDDYFSESEVLARGTVFVVLAEPGAGKTQLLIEFGRLLGAAPIRGSRFRHQTQNLVHRSLIVDALDEVAKVDQSAVDNIIVRARETSTGTVVFASRSSEWQDARTRLLRDCFGADPVVIRIEPLTIEEQRDLFAAYLPTENFDAFVEEANRFELSPLLGNPQFLQLFGDAFVQSGRKFTTKAQIFRDAVLRLAIEAGDAVPGIQRPATGEIVDAASEAMAKILLSGASGISVKEYPDDIDYPYLRSLGLADTSAAINALDTRLFKPASEPDRHEPVHRIVAEYCAAQYIVGRITDKVHSLSLKRVLSVVAPNGAVRDELRGLLGWMASVGTERIQRAAIELDAYAILANGDPSQLTSKSKKLLLQQLADIAEKNPGFRRGDYWRRFSVGGFITIDLVDDIRSMLRSTALTSPLLDLVLELISNSGGPASLLNDVRAIMLDAKADRHARTLGARAALKLGMVPADGDCETLIREGSVVSLRLAADLISDAGVEKFPPETVDILLQGFIDMSPPRHAYRDDDDYMAEHYLKHIISQISVERSVEILDRLTTGLKCTCENPGYDCHCRHGVSKIVGKFLDHYFEKATTSHDPDRIWGWVRNLWYEHGGNAEKSASIKALFEDNELRHQLHRRAFEGAVDPETAWGVHWHINGGHSHSGLAYCEGDQMRMAEHAFATENPGLWSAFWARPKNQKETRGPDPYRRRLREQAAQNPDFLKRWVLLERNFRVMRLEQQRQWERRQRRWGRRRQEQAENDRTHLRENLEAVRNGEHWGWVRTLARAFLFEPEHLSKYTDDISLVEDALRNCLQHIEEHIPTLEQMAESSFSSSVAYVAFLSCWLHFKERGSLAQFGSAILSAAKVESGKYSSLSADDYEAFERELDNQLFKETDSAERFVRALIEPGLLGPRDGHTRVWHLANKTAFAHLRGSLSMEWLRAHPMMPVLARDTLFNLAATHADRGDLLELIEERTKQGICGPELEAATEAEHRSLDQRFWELRKFFFAQSHDDGWVNLKNDPNAIFSIDEKAGRFGDREDGWPALNADKIFKIVDAFVEKWPPVYLPSSYGTGDPPSERAFRFLTDVVWRIGTDTPDRSLPVLDKMLGDKRFCSFDEALRTQRAEAVKKLALSGYNAPNPEDVVSLFAATGIASVEDLRAFAIEELAFLQEWLRMAETDPLATYYNGGRHVDENTARNRVVDSLASRMTAMNMPIAIEHHMAEGNRCDFTVSAALAGRRRLLVIEAKGQWHPQLYSAASAQLNERYASHPDAEKQGIYLVFWFGTEINVAGRRRHGISSASELQNKIFDAMPEELKGLIDVVVLDLSRAQGTPYRQSRAAVVA